jgi:ribose-phosphate pyrophosphokinase
MKTLNLVDLDKSDIKYKTIPYPDGQRDIVIDKSTLYQYEFGTPIEIKSRLNNAEDLLMIVCATKALRNLKVKDIHLYTTYIMGLRSDRLFQEGGNRYVKDIIAPILNAQNFESVTCIDPHSDVAENCINNLIKLSNLQLVNYTFNDLNDTNNNKQPKGCSGTLSLENYILVSPDTGASKKIYKLAEQIGYKGDVITCSKDRDTDGKLTKTVVPIDGKNLEKDVIIIDDICDGGATFINIAKVLKSYKEFKGKIYLIVTHGIFSKGLEELGEYFESIYCTNSYQDYEPDNDGQDYIYPHLVKQLDVF